MAARRRKPKSPTTRKAPKAPRPPTPREPPSGVSLYDAERHPTIAFEQALLGKDDAAIAKNLGIALRTIHLWKKAHPEFAHALTRGKDLADGAVVRSLYERATGYSQKALKFFYDKDAGKVIEHEYVERFPPDTTAMIFWLKNRQRLHWRDRHELAGDPEAPFVFQPEVPQAQRHGGAAEGGAGSGTGGTS